MKRVTLLTLTLGLLAAADAQAWVDNDNDNIDDTYEIYLQNLFAPVVYINTGYE
ncbi:MAG: hypothetical protein MJD61_17945 [Proteobacteria bacterium]|nr:hypothetical protein [Pseudomonadota bacterium]